MDDSAPHGKWRAKLPGSGLANGNPVGVVPDHRLRSDPKTVEELLREAMEDEPFSGTVVFNPKELGSGKPQFVDCPDGIIPGSDTAPAAKPKSESSSDLLYNPPVKWDPIEASKHYPVPSDRIDAYEKWLEQRSKPSGKFVEGAWAHKIPGLKVMI